MSSSPYHRSTEKYLSQKTGTIDQVLWSAQSSPFKVIAVLSFTDGEELGSIAVDDTMLSCIQPGKTGTFVFGNAGEYGVLVRANNHTADNRAWRRAAQTKFWQAAGWALIGACLVAWAQSNPTIVSSVLALLPLLLAGWFGLQCRARQRISNIIRDRRQERAARVGTPTSVQYGVSM